MTFQVHLTETLVALMYSYLFFYLLFPAMLVTALAGVYLVTGISFLDLISSLSKRTAKLTCWHCQNETPANRKTCQHCGKELQ